MSSPAPEAAGPDETGRGPRSRAVAVSRWFVVVEGLLLLTTVPALVPLLFLEREWSNVPLGVALLIPVGPAVSAALFAWRKFSEDAGLSPAQQFWRGYRLNWADALRVWTPSLVVLALLAVNLANAWLTEMPLAFGVVGGLVAVVATMWVAHALVVLSLFSFRTRDVARMAVYFVIAKPLSGLGAVALVVLAVAVVQVTAAWVVLLLASVLTFLLLLVERPVVSVVLRRFVVGAPEAVQAKPWPGLDGVAEGTDPDGEPTDDEPTDDEPTDDEPTDDEPTDDEPTDDEPTDDEPTDEGAVREPGT